jgi:hypothetical protein
VKELKGANMDIDLINNGKVSWEQETCPWNKAEKDNKHKCAEKNSSICPYFKVINYPDIILCSYPQLKNKN